MKIALCLYGRVGNKSTKTLNSPDCSDEILSIGHSYYKDYLFNNHDVDVYIHSWSEKLSSQIIDIYKPKRSLIEKQEVFKIPAHVKGNSIRIQAHWSRWCSTKKAADLVDLTIKYDLCIMSRLDLTWKINPINLNSDNFYIQKWCCFGENNVDIYNLGSFNKSKKVDISTLPHFHKDISYGMLDWFFISSVNNIQRFSQLYDNINEYSKNGYDCNGAISSHTMGLMHLKNIGLYDKIKDEYHITDCQLIRREIFGAMR